MAQALRFDDVVEAADRLSEEEQETLLELLRRRLAERRRDEIAEHVHAARREYERGETRVASVDELMDEILT